MPATPLTWLRTLASRLDLSAACFTVVVAGAMLAGAIGYSFLSYSPDNPAVLSKAQRRQANADIASSQRALATDTPHAKAAHLAGRAHLDTAQAHAARALSLHRQTAAPRHASKLTRPAAAVPTAEQLRRELTSR